MNANARTAVAPAELVLPSQHNRCASETGHHAKVSMLNSFAVLFGVVIGAIASAGPASAQQNASDFPEKPIHIVVAVPAGGGVDTIARVLAARLQNRFGQPVIVENRAGAGGNIGAAAVASAAADGYTLLASPPAPLTVNAVLYKKLDYDPAALRPVAIMALSPNVLAVRKGLPVKNVADLIAYAKANPDKLTYASQGSGTTSHLTTEMFARATGTRFQHVPYKGTAPALNDLAGDHVDLMFVDLGSVIKLHEAGRVRIIAAASADRIPSLAEIPSVLESGVAGFNSTTWYALTAPPKTPPAVMQKLNAAIADIQRLPEIEARYKELFVQTSPGTTAEMAAFVKDETRRWVDIIRAANITLE